MSELGYQFLTRPQRQAALAIGLACIAVGLYIQIKLWQLDPTGISIAGERLPYWDFSNLWAGSRMALEGKADLLFDVDAYRRELDAIYGVKLPDQEWSYPPSILLIGVPLAYLPIGAAFALWSAGTLFLFHLALRSFRLPAIAHCLVLLGPAIWSNQMFGQNGALTAALLLAGLLNAPTRPVLAGILIGLLTLKPHLGILLPFCLLASRNYTAIVSATVTALTMVVLTGLLFGFEVWTLFFTETRALMTWIMEAPYPQAYHTHVATVFVTMRSLGASVSGAYMVQLAVTGLAIVAVWILWRPGDGLDHLSRVCMTSVFVIVATPYGYTHDTAALYLAIAWFFLRDPKPFLPVHALVWLFPLVSPRFHDIHLSAGVLAPLGFAIWLFHAYLTGSRGFPHFSRANNPATACAAPLPRPGDPRPS